MPALSFVLRSLVVLLFLFFFNDTATTEIYTLSLHDALPIYRELVARDGTHVLFVQYSPDHDRSEEHTSELQSPCNLVCHLLLEKKKKKIQRVSDRTLNSTLRCISLSDLFD